MYIAYVFPGQGAQFKGMGTELLDAFPTYVREADRILGYSIKSLCLEDPRGVLSQTEYTQPALYTIGALTYLERKQNGGAESAAYLAGHSLGEYCALFAAGAFDFSTGLTLVKRRGELMSQAPKGAMAAIIGLSVEAIRDILRQADLEAVDLANINSGNQIILSGLYDDIHSSRMASMFEKAGATFVPLNVSAAFHSRYMRNVERQFSDYLAAFTLRPLCADVISNVTARPYPREGYADLLSKQISSPVKWYETVSWLLAHGCERIEQLGPGTVLTKLTTSIKAAPMRIDAHSMPVSSPPKKRGANRALFMYGGQGTQYFQMGRQLYDKHSVFRQHFDACSALVEPELGQSLVQIVYDDARQVYDPFDSILHTHPALFSVGYALTAVLREEGIEPQAALGYSLGEYVGLTVAGYLSWQDGLRLTMRQARLIMNMCPKGGMLSVLTPLAHFDTHPEIYDGVELAGVNFDENFCVSGPRAVLDRTKAKLTEAGVLSIDLPVQYPFHSSYIGSMRDEIKALAVDIVPRSPRIPYYSPTYGRMIDERDLTDLGEYVWNIVRKRVDFYRLIRTLTLDTPSRVFLDLSASGSLANFIKYISRGSTRHHHVINQFGKDLDNLAALRQAFADLQETEYVG
ncbi:ACP S-malonyltransferase [Mycetohabitans sp. B8]|uniref:[acyl-carrier-protein] S-malonyltransferase n=1 Tax=Burkholderia sp. B8(2020) TaxID=2713619 RepID=A0A6G6CWX4_9BURK|nr:ACP S-malonyltransferase [Mycetohabitans sp. B8]MCG1041035.1 ACP S-malonyltransferase [Mycetohabitans sp. B8]QIE07361.1 polyketide synthase NecB [Burkholderia sp. B8(2020)]